MGKRRLLLMLAGAATAAWGGPIRGGVYGADMEKPVAGALVALYRSGDDLMAGFTYSDERGRFALAGPVEAGMYYAVATHEGRARRIEPFRYEPAKEERNLTILFAKPSTARALLAWVAGKMRELVSFLAGFFAGLFKQRFEGRLQFQRQKGYLETLRQKLEEQHQKLSAVCDEIMSHTQTDQNLQSKYEQLTKVAADTAAEMEARLPDAATVFEMERKPGRERYYEFRRQVIEVRRCAKTSYADVFAIAGKDKKKHRDELLRPFTELAGNQWLNS